MKLMIALMLFLPLMAFAKKGEKFEQHKAEAIKRIETRLQNITQHKNCVMAAQDRAALKECRKKNKELHKGMRNERMMRKEERMKKRMERMKNK